MPYYVDFVKFILNLLILFLKLLILGCQFDALLKHFFLTQAVSLPNRALLSWDTFWTAVPFLNSLRCYLSSLEYGNAIEYNSAQIIFEVLSEKLIDVGILFWPVDHAPPLLFQLPDCLKY